MTSLWLTWLMEPRIWVTKVENSSPGSKSLKNGLQIVWNMRKWPTTTLLFNRRTRKPTLEIATENLSEDLIVNMTKILLHVTTDKIDWSTDKLPETYEKKAFPNTKRQCIFVTLPTNSFQLDPTKRVIISMFFLFISN